MSSISIQQLATIPYLDSANLHGRTICSLAFHDAGAWRTWAVAGHQLIEMQAWPAEAFYFSKDAADPNDIYLHFLDFMSQRANFPQITLALDGIRDDVFNLSASLAKIEHIQATHLTVGAGATRMVGSEIEYLFLVFRSIFDLLQEVARKLWETITLFDADIKKKPLTSSFNAMIRYEGKPVTREILARRFGLPDPMADYYVKWQNFFDSLKGFRDNLVHHGSRVQTVFLGESGFAISRSLKPFHDLNIWRDDERLPNELVPLMPVLGVIVHKTLVACEEFSQMLSVIVKFPPPTVPGMKLFMRGYFNESFTRILRDAAERKAPPDAAAG